MFSLINRQSFLKSDEIIIIHDVVQGKSMVLLISVIFGEITSFFCYSSDGLKIICYDYDRIWYFRDSLTLKVRKTGFEIKSEHCIFQDGLRLKSAAFTILGTMASD